APLTALTPAGTVTVSSVAAGNRGASVVNCATRVSIQRHDPATGGSIRIGSVDSLPTAATATIGSANRTRISDSRSTSPTGSTCGGASGASDALGGTGLSAICVPRGATNAIGCTLPDRGGGGDGGRIAGAAAADTLGSGSRRASKPRVVSASSGVTTASVDTA